MKRIISLLAVLLLMTVSNSYAAPGAYGAVGGGLMNFDDGFDSIKPKQLIFRLGYDFNDYFGLGYEGGFSLIKDDLFGVDYDVTTSFFYLKGSYPVSNNAKIYLLAGPTNVELTGEVGGFSVSADDDDTGIGFGFETQLTSARLFFDYITYNNNDGADVSSLNLGAAFDF